MDDGSNGNHRNQAQHGVPLMAYVLWIMAEIMWALMGAFRVEILNALFYSVPRLLIWL